MMRVRIDQKEVTAYLRCAKWGGDLGSAARTLSLDFLRGAYGEVGSKVALYVDGRLLFYGVCVYMEAETLEAMDYGIYLARNKTFREYVGAPQDIAVAVCAEFGVPVGRFEELSEQQTVQSTGDLSAYQVIDRAYNGEDRNQRIKPYHIYMRATHLFIVKTGWHMSATLRETLKEATYRHSIKSMVNRVVILGDQNAVSGEVQNEGDRARYGTFGETYRAQEDKDAPTEAGKLLQPIEIGGKLTALGNVGCVSGAAVAVQYAKSRLNGVYVIKSDSHTFDGESHEMSLEVERYEAK